jgi:hypothetical protein
MKSKTLLAGVFCLLFSLPVFAGNKKHGQRAMIEKMEAVPCGAKERGMNGLGSLWASVGITSVNTDEKLCPQYMLRTDDMEYHVRPKDHKHPVLLPIGHEGEFKIDKDVMEMKIPDGDHKSRKYQVVSMKPIDHAQTAVDLDSTKPDTYKPQNNANNANNLNGKPVAVQPQTIQPQAQPVPKPD